MVDSAERYLKQLGIPALRELRVRYHAGDLARIEVQPTAIAPLSQPELRAQIVHHFTELGFRFVTIDLVGFESGSLNVLVPREALASPPHHS